MREPRRSFVFCLESAPDGKFRVCKGHGLFKFKWPIPRTFTLFGNTVPKFPEHPISMQEFYAILSDLAGRGFRDDLLSSDGG